MIAPQRDSQRARVRINALGGFRILVAGRDIRLRTRKEAILLLRLALEMPDPVRRDECVALLWPDSPEARARHSLSEALRGISQGTGLEVLRTPESLALDPESISTDVSELLAAIDGGDVDAAARLYHGDFLSGWYPPTAEASHWVDGTSADLLVRLERMLREQLELRRQATDSRGVTATVQLLERLGVATPADQEAAAEAEQVTGWESLHPGDPILPRIPLDREGPFVGRTEEMRLLTSELERALAGELRVVLVSGEPGIGKTRTCQRLARLAALRGARLFLSSCYELEQSVAFGAISEALVGSITPSDIAGIKPMWQQVLSQVMPELTEMLDSKEELPTADYETRNRWLLQAAAALFDAMGATRPCLLHLDDLQWADPSTCRLLHYVARKSEPAGGALILLSLRPDEASTNSAALTLIRDLAATIIDLAPLPPDQIRQQVLRLQPGLAGDRADAIAKKAGGNPFFARELALASNSRSETLPASVRELIAARTARVGETAAQLLALLAAAGGRLRVDLMARALEVPITDLLRPLDELRSLALVKEEGTVVCFDHDLVRESVYASLSDTTRRAYHLLLAEHAFEQFGPPALAQHFRLGGRMERAYEVALQAAEDSSRDYASAERLELLEMALLNAPPHELSYVASRFALQCAEAGNFNRLFSRLQPVYDSMPAKLRVKIDLAGLKAKSLRDFDGYSAARLHVDELLHRANQHSKADYVEVAREKLRFAHQAGAADEVLRTIDELTAFAEADGWTAEAARALCFSGFQQVFYAPEGGVQRGLRRAANIAKSIGDVHLMAQAQLGIGLYHVVQGSTQDAATELNLALSGARKHHLLPQEFQARALLMSVEIDRLRLIRALRHSYIILGKANPADHANPIMLARLNRAICYTEMQESQLAEREADEVLRMERGHPDWLVRAGGYALKGLAAMEQARVAEARACDAAVEQCSPALEEWSDDPTYPLLLRSAVLRASGKEEVALRQAASVAEALLGKNRVGYWAAVLEQGRLSKRLKRDMDREKVEQVRSDAAACGNRLIHKQADDLLVT